MSLPSLYAIQRDDDMQCKAICPERWFLEIYSMQLGISHYKYHGICMAHLHESRARVSSCWHAVFNAKCKSKILKITAHTCELLVRTKFSDFSRISDFRLRIEGVMCLCVLPCDFQRNTCGIKLLVHGPMEVRNSWSRKASSS